MRFFATLILLLVLPAGRAGQAQTPPARAWSVGLALDRLHFSESLTDTLARPDLAAGLRPNPRTGLRAVVTRAYRMWRLELELGWAGGNVEAANRSVAVRDKTTQVTRWRVAASFDRHLAYLGSGELGLALAPTLDWWSVGGAGRVCAGVEARLGLRAPLGAVELENRIAVGVSGSPLLPADAGPGFESRRQLAFAAGLGLRVPL